MGLPAGAMSTSSQPLQQAERASEAHSPGLYTDLLKRARPLHRPPEMRLSCGQVHMLADAGGELAKALGLELDAAAFFGNSRGKR